MMGHVFLPPAFVSFYRTFQLMILSRAACKQLIEERRGRKALHSYSPTGNGFSTLLVLRTHTFLRSPKIFNRKNASSTRENSQASLEILQPHFARWKRKFSCFGADFRQRKFRAFGHSTPLKVSKLIEDNFSERKFSSTPITSFSLHSKRSRLFTSRTFSTLQLSPQHIGDFALSSTHHLVNDLLEKHAETLLV